MWILELTIKLNYDASISVAIGKGFVARNNTSDLFVIVASQIIFKDAETFGSLGNLESLQFIESKN